MILPARSCVSVVAPNDSVPAYSLSSLMSKSWIFVPRPRVNKSSPVAIGSSVPQWPTFLIWRRRRTSATTSCDVMPAALSTSRTPSGVAVNDMANCFQDPSFYFRQSSFDPRAGGQLMPAAAKTLADCGDIRRFALRPHADAHLAFRQFLKKDGNDYALDRAEVIDQPLIVFRQHAELFRRLQREAEARNLPAC